MALLSLTNITIAVAVLYVAYIAHQMHKMLNPLSGVVVTGPVIEPLWKEDTPFDMVCFLSTHKRMKFMNITKIRESGQLVYEQAGMLFNPQQNLSDINLRIQNPNSENVSQHSITASAPIWHELTSNKTSVFLHVLLVRSTPIATTHTSTSRETSDTLATISYPEIVNLKSLQTGQALYGVVRLVKQARIPKHFHHRPLLADWGWVNITPNEAARLAMPRDTVISYWKPEVAVKLVSDATSYPLSNVPQAVYRNVVQSKTPTALQYKPSLFVDEIGLTTDKYIPLNSSVRSLPLHLSFAPLSVPRYLLIAQLEESLRAQTDLGFTEKDLDEVRRLISETSLQLLGLTMLASLLHLLFEWLAFQSDISFWKDNKSLAGLSTRALVTDLISQAIVFLFLLDAEASLLVLGPTGFGLLVQLWKVHKATGLEVRLGRYGVPEVCFQRWALQQADAAAALLDDRGSTAVKEAACSNPNASCDSGDRQGRVESSNAAAGMLCTALDTSLSSDGSGLHQETQEEMERELTRVTLQADSFATTYLSALLFPLVLAFALRSLLYDRHLSWYSWALGAATGCVYTFGFVLMCPQLYINHKLQSVSHLPWNFLVYKFLNTFIDDLFAFIIKMPTMHRLSVFRDDLVFFVYLYQRWVYRVDTRRPVEK